LQTYIISIIYYFLVFVLEIGIYIPARYVFTLTVLVTSGSMITLASLVFVFVNENVKTKMKQSDLQPSDRTINCMWLLQRALYNKQLLTDFL